MMQRAWTFGSVALLLGTGLALASEPHSSGVTPKLALEMLLKGNAAYVKGDQQELKKETTSKRRAEVAGGQHPFAAILTCADSRVPPEVFFNQGLGEIFVVRVAGNIASSEVIGSLDYAVEHLGVSLVMVLGHSSCGAVSATYDAHQSKGEVEGPVGSLIRAIEPAVEKALTADSSGDRAAQVDRCITSNVHEVTEVLRAQSKVIAHALEEHKIDLVMARYELSTGVVSLVK